jgi:hypothetical protein
MKEEWRPVRLGVLNQPSDYEISNLGRVRRGGKVLRPYRCPTRNGMYLKVDLRVAGSRYQRFVHRLVAIAFVQNPDQKPDVNHGDTDNLNNRADNLEWATRVEQEAHKHFMEATA